MYIKVFEGKSAEELEDKVNDYLKDIDEEEYDLDNIVQSESFLELNGNLERRITLTLVFVESLFRLDDDDDDDF